MTQLIEAIYENGVFRPLNRIELAEHERVSLVVNSTAAGSASLVQQQEALQALRKDMDALPVGSAEDGLGGADHDQILYGDAP